jgi:hypothetical protein
LDTGVDPRLDPVLRKALETHPGDRFQTAREMAEALRKAIAPVPPAPAENNKRSGRRIAMALLFCLIVALPLVAILSDVVRVGSQDELLLEAVPIQLESPLRLDRVAAFTITPPSEEPPAFLHLEIRGVLNGDAWIGGYRVEGEVDLYLSRPVAPGEDHLFEYIPVAATDGELTVTYWFSD